MSKPWKYFKKQYAKTVSLLNSFFRKYKTLCKHSVHCIQLHGEGNQVPYCPPDLEIIIYGNNNTVEIAPTVKHFCGKILIGDPFTSSSGCVVKIGSGTTANGVNIVMYENNSSVIIGQCCMFAYNITIWNTDSHSIYDIKTKQCVNMGKEISIADHVWVGMNVHILKNTAIGKGSIVGAASCVTKKFTEENIILAGVPAQVVKRGVGWSSLRVNDYIKRTQI